MIKQNQKVNVIHIITAQISYTHINNKFGGKLNQKNCPKFQSLQLRDFHFFLLFLIRVSQVNILIKIISNMYI